ncbi:MAG: carbohydrate-binding domain-containing protein [Clostridia bacterium]|nr:carbohydrate-binding domain-containing protein [Clostridia bacterium]
MKRKCITLLSILLAAGVFFASCSLLPGNSETSGDPGNSSQSSPEGTTVEDDNEVETKTTDEAEETFTLIESTEDSYTYQNADGTKTATLTVALSEGSAVWRVEGNTLTIENVTEDSVIELSGVFYGNIVATVDDDYKLELALKGLTIYSYNACPIYVEGGDKITISAKKETENLVFDLREAVGEEDVSAAIYVTSDLDLQGKGALYVTSEHNNGIHTKDDLKVKNLTLQVECEDNALKGNDSLTIESGTITLIARSGDGIKTSNSDISSKGKQRGTVSILAGKILIYAAEDGIDAAYNVEIAENDELDLQIFTERYSKYTEATSTASSATSILPTNTATGQSGFGGNTQSGFGGNGQSGQGRPGQGGQGGFSGGQGGFPGGQGGFGGMTEGNSDKSDTSSKGLKADNEILIAGGNITIASYDDAIHANSDEELENGESALGNVTISGGTLVLASNDDGIHADGILTISGGNVKVTKSYEGLEGNTVVLSGGSISVVASDDGVNAKATTGEGILVSGGNIYVYAGGDGLDANSQAQYDGIRFAGGNVVVISTGNGNSSIDTERGYSYTGGSVVAIGLSGGMGNESTKCQNLSSVGSTKTLSLQKDAYLVVEGFATVKLPASLNALVVVLGKTSANIASASSSSATLDENGVFWQD